jgi:hypothetical protein
MIVAWHEVPGKASPGEPSRRVRYDRTQLSQRSQRYFSSNMCAVFLLGRRLYAFLERLVSDDVRAGARCNGTFSETCEIPRLNAKKSLMNPSQYFFSYRIRNFVTPIIESVRTPAGITPYPTGRPSFGRRPRHFVPGYDRTVPPGQKPFAHRKASH